MPIFIPDRTQIRITNDFVEPNNAIALPAMLAEIAMTNAGCVSVSTNGATSTPALQARCVPASATNGANGYIGFNPDNNVAAGGAVSPCRNVIIDGYTGVLPGQSVFIDATNADAAGGTNSGVTHTQQTNGVNLSRVGVGWSATKIYFF